NSFTAVGRNSADTAYAMRSGAGKAPQEVLLPDIRSVSHNWTGSSASRVDKLGGLIGLEGPPVLAFRHFKGVSERA
ncbi:MAG: hypothetical protein ACREVW_13500, partial [Burkholderiales bacterium]